MVVFLSEDSKFIFGGKEGNVLFKKKQPAVAGVRKESWKFARAGNLA